MFKFKKLFYVHAATAAKLAVAEVISTTGVEGLEDSLECRLVTPLSCSISHHDPRWELSWYLANVPPLPAPSHPETVMCGCVCVCVAESQTEWLLSSWGISHGVKGGSGGREGWR